MPKMDFTAASVTALAAGSVLVEYQDTRQPGLSLRVTPAGIKSWTLRYRLRNGARKRIGLGSFPAMPVSIARTEAAKLIGAVAKGEDPVGDLKAERKRENQVRLETVAAIGDRYIELAAEGKHRMKGTPLKPNSMLEEKRYLAVIKAALGGERLADLTRAEIQVFIDNTGKSMSPSAARHSRSVLQRIYAFAIWQDIVTTDPIRYVSAPTWTPRERVLTDDELQALWQGIDTVAALPDVDLSRATGIAIKLAALTLQRRAEIVGIHLDEIDEGRKLWTIPGERTKNGRSHVVPLSDAALELIQSAREGRVNRARESEFLFPSPRDPTKPIGAMALTHAWRRLVPHLTIPSPTTKNPDRRKKVEGITPHDLRRTGATNLTGERLGIPRFIVSKVLNHTGDTDGAAGVTAVYDRNAYLAEKRRALDGWAHLLLEIVGRREAGA